MTTALAYIVGGGLILLAGIRNRTITEILQGVTSPNPSTPTAPTASGDTAAPAAPGGKGGNRALGYALMQQHYPQWARDPQQWPCLEKLWTQESDWQDKTNPTSGARGIPQALPASKMGAVAQGHGHAAIVAQILWGLSYIHERYKTPCAAWAHEQANNWY